MGSDRTHGILQPGSGSAPEIEDAVAGTQQPNALINLVELVDRPGREAGCTGLAEEWIVADTRIAETSALLRHAVSTPPG